MVPHVYKAILPSAFSEMQKMNTKNRKNLHEVIPGLSGLDYFIIC